MSFSSRTSGRSSSTTFTSSTGRKCVCDRACSSSRSRSSGTSPRRTPKMSAATAAMVSSVTGVSAENSAPRAALSRFVRVSAAMIITDSPPT
jgi:hypothetical protein